MKRLGTAAFAVLGITLGLGVACSSDDEGNEVTPGGDGTGATSSGGSGGSAGTTTSPGGAPTGSGGGSAGEFQWDSGTGGGTGGGTYVECPSLSGLDTCEFQTEQAEHLEVNVLLVMDKSGSMSVETYGTTTKWEAMSTALTAALNDARDVLNLGLAFFPSAISDIPIPPSCGDVDRCCEMPGGADMNVNIGAGAITVPQILSEMNSAIPAGGTPTAAALNRAYTYFTSGPGATLGGERIVLLATDGGPNCNASTSCTVDECTLNIDNADGNCPPDGLSCCGNNAEACLDHAGTLAQIQQLAQANVKTIVVGIPGAEQYYSRLEEYAQAGGFINPDGSIGYYEVPASGGVDELTATFRTITTALVQECEIPITEEIPNLNTVNVAVDCGVIPQGEETGTESRWYFDQLPNPTRIIINGPICDTIQSTGVDRIDTVYGCPTQTIG